MKSVIIIRLCPHIWLSLAPECGWGAFPSVKGYHHLLWALIPPFLCLLFFSLFWHSPKPANNSMFLPFIKNPPLTSDPSPTTKQSIISASLLILSVYYLPRLPFNSADCYSFVRMISDSFPNYDTRHYLQPTKSDRCLRRAPIIPQNTPVKLPVYFSSLESRATRLGP